MRTSLGLGFGVYKKKLDSLTPDFFDGATSLLFDSQSFEIGASNTIKTIYDKSQNLLLDTPQVTPFDFTQSQWTKTAAVTGFTQNSFTTNAAGGIYRLFTFLPRSVHQVEFEIATSAGTVTLYNANNTASSTMIGTVSAGSPQRFVASVNYLYIRVDVAATVTVTSLATKRVLGNHVSNNTQATRPVLVNNDVVFNGTTQFLRSAQSTTVNMASIFIVAKRPGDEGYYLFRTLSGFGDLTGGILTLGASGETTPLTYYGFNIKALIIRTNTDLDNQIETYLAVKYDIILTPSEYEAYLSRITADLGVVDDNQFTLDYLKFLKQQGTLENTKLLIAPEMGTKRRVSGVNTYVSKAFDAANSEDEGIEKVVNGDFESGQILTKGDASGSVSTLTLNTINPISGLQDARLIITTAANGFPYINNPISSGAMGIVGKYYKISFLYKVNSGIFTIKGIYDGTKQVNINSSLTDTGTFTYIIQCLSSAAFSALYAGNTICDVQIDNYSIQELDWNDATQSTELSQPWLSGNIAPNERLALKNPNGGGNRLLTHPMISYANNENWSASIVFKWNGVAASYNLLCGKSNATYEGLSVRTDNAGLRFQNSLGTDYNIVGDQFKKYYTKQVILTVIASNGNLLYYVNGSYKGASVANTSVNFGIILSNLGQGHNIYSYRIQSSALTPEQVTAEHNFLRTRFPEMESVVINNQEWTLNNYEAVATPQGNVIQEMQANAAVERVVNGGFDTDTNWTKGAGWTISGGTLNATTAASSAYQSVGITVGKWYKATYTISNYVTGGVRLNLGAYTLSTTRNSNGTFTEYIKVINTSSNGLLYIQDAGTFTGSIDNISIQELGWANSTEIYDAVYAATSGTVEQKTYAAVKEAAMWCHYNNDASIGAIYGKLYNWYAAKLLQMDIDYYNAANPTTPWGWRVPLVAEFTNLINNQGGENIAGLTTKAQSPYWDSFAGNNLSGLTILGAGRRNGLGEYGFMRQYTYHWASDALLHLRCTFVDNTLTATSGTPSWGMSIRLIKTT